MGKLEENFIVPPFSILDTKQEYWQNRRRNWLALGIKSEIGRDAKAYSCNDDNTKKYDYLPNIKTGTSIFDPVLCELMYKWFCPTKGKILDPFAGGSVRGIIASKTGYFYTGIDLSAEQIKANYEQSNKILKEVPVPEWFCGDSLVALDDLNEEFDFIFSCPPYFDLEKYSELDEDLSNMSWDKFKETYFKIIKKAVLKLKNNSFACFVVGEVRDKNGFYINFVDETKKGFIEAGTKFYNEMILVNAVGTLPIRIGGQFGKYRKIGKMHQNILVFYKGDNCKEIINRFGKIETGLKENKSLFNFKETTPTEHVESIEPTEPIKPEPIKTEPVVKKEKTGLFGGWK